MPENEAKKLIIANLKCIDMELDEIMLQPFVSSILPRNVPYNIFLGILNKFSILKNMSFMKFIFFNIDIITENATTYEHTDNVVFNASLIDLSNATLKLISLKEVFCALN